ncbi:unnamed protein product [Didymodactylos carnosus]|uniref:Uncharacterized protein n=1 Tax=Didymodactylos carnosus TaxID=1234261 RepID=A0A813XX92_9BILA|nr:unnamed protein product [Didymodactylos carnosus]CAF3663800.1 unnamed protein product [Didymodactylos carnosus]
MKYINKTILVALFIEITLPTLLQAQAKDVCRLPKSFKKNYDFKHKLRSHEWVNLNGTTDYLVLVLSWTPQFCKYQPARQRQENFQCKPENKFGLIVHGLWPQSKKTRGRGGVRSHPRNCKDDKQLDISLIKSYFCLMPDEILQQAEWEKHGTCAFKSPEEYFKTMSQLYSKVNLPDMNQLLKDKHLHKKKVEAAFLKKNPGLHIVTTTYRGPHKSVTETDAIIVSMRRKELEEIKICFDLKHNFTIITETEYGEGMLYPR